MTEDSNTRRARISASNLPEEFHIKDPVAYQREFEQARSAGSSQPGLNGQDEMLPEPPAIVDEESAAAYREKHHRGRSDPSCWYDSVKFVDRVAMHLFERGWLARKAADTGEGPTSQEEALAEFKKTWFKGSPPEEEMNHETKRLAQFGVVLFGEGWSARLAHTS